MTPGVEKPRIFLVCYGKAIYRCKLIFGLSLSYMVLVSFPKCFARLSPHCLLNRCFYVHAERRGNFNSFCSLPISFHQETYERCTKVNRLCGQDTDVSEGADELVN